LLRLLEETDLELILAWRNAPAVRQSMFTQHEISMKEHHAWFARTQNDPSTRWFLYLDKNNQPMGVVYFTKIDHDQKAAFWGFYASPDATLGTGIRMENDALRQAFDELNFCKLNCEVLSTNPSVINMHKKVGFIEEGRFREQFFNG
jgi:UDP-4-amino-4,6-dideoxy-N-acetyl-beta-L-altrosamine N-acetyltransferase